MLFPEKTEFKKRIPQQKFYTNMEITSNLKKAFVEQIKIIYWQNKLTSTTLNIDKGKSVLEIEVIEIKLNSKNLDEMVLSKIDKCIPYHILFLLEYEGMYQAFISYKEIENEKIKVNKYYHTQWLEIENLPCKIEGLNMDSVYENFVRQIAGAELNVGSQEKKNLKEDIEQAEEKKQLEKQISALQAKIRKTKQFNRKVELNNELKKLKKMLEKFQLKRFYVYLRESKKIGSLILYKIK